MTLAEKQSQLREEMQPQDSLIGTRVEVAIDGEIIAGNFRQMQSNGQANIYLDESYVNRKGKNTRWIKTSPGTVSIME